jgi:D-alanyl-lipoteichoic acid acyltransferase DltB (MBOAT superfamily)
VFYLRISLVADFAYGLSCFAGYHLTDAFDAPFLAENPINFWQTWNLPVLSFLRRAFIFPLARRRRSLTVTVIAGMVGSALMHAVINWLKAGHDLSVARVLGNLQNNAIYYTATGLVLAMGIPFYQAVNTRRLPTRILMAVITQTGMALLFFNTTGEICRGVTGLPDPVQVAFGLLTSLFHR